MADNFGLKIGVEGEKEFKKALAEINQNFKVLGSEMKLVSSQFDKNDKSVDALTARNKVLSKEIDEQKNKIELLKQALDNASTSFGENDRRTQQWQIKLNNAQATLNDLEKELKDNNDTLDKTADELNDAEKEADDFGDEIDDAGKQSDSAGGKFSKVKGIVAGFGKALAGATAAIGAAAVATGKKLKDMADVTAAAGDEIDKNSQRLGLSKKAYQEWDYVLSQSGVDINSVQTGFKSMTNSIDDAKNGSETAIKKFTDLGISMSDLKTMSREDIFGKAVEGLQNITDDTTKAALANDLFGKSGQNIMPLLNATADSTQNLRDKAHELGLVMSDEAVQAAVDYTDNMDTLQRTFTGLKNSIMGDILPGFNDILLGLTGLMTGADGAKQQLQLGAQEIVTSISGIFPQLTEILLTLVTAIAGVAPSIIQALVTGIAENLPALVESASNIILTFVSSIILALPQITEGALQLVMTLTNGIIENLPLLLTAAIQVIATLVTGIAESLPQLIPAMVECIVTMVQGLIDNLPLLLDAALQLITGLAQGLLDALPVLIAALPDIIIGIVTFLLDSIPQIIDAGIKLLTSLVDALPQIITAIVNAIPKIINGIINAVINAIPQIIQAGIDLLIALIRALPQIITTIVKAIPQIISGIVDALIGNIDKIIMAGVELFIALIENLPTIIVEIVKAVPKIIEGIVKAFGSLMGKIVEIGGNIVKGLWDGICGLASWLWEQVSGWISGIWDGICSFFGIHSPSKEMAWVGEMLVKGLAGSIDDNGDKAVKAAENMSSDISDVMNTLSDDMKTALPTDFSVDGNIKSSLDSSMSGANGKSGLSLVLNITNFNNYSSEDINQLTNEIMETAGQFAKKERYGVCVNYFEYNGVKSSDLGLHIQSKNVYSSPKFDSQFVSVPGRNGDLIVSNNRFENIQISYNVFLLAKSIDELSEKLRKVKSWLYSQPTGYHTLTDSYDKKFFRKAVFASSLDIEDELNKIGVFTISFNCKPFKYSFDGNLPHYIKGTVSDLSDFSLIFCRMDGSTGDNNWDNRWNQTVDLKISGDNNMYIIAENSWGDGNWGTYSPSQSNTVYLQVNENWKKDNARFAVFIFGSKGEHWYSMTKVTDNIYSAVLPTPSYTTLENPYSFESKPYIRVFGSGDGTLTIESQNGRRQWSFKNIDEYLEIDSEQMNFYKDTVLKNDTVAGSGFPTLAPGENKFILGGGVTNLSVFPRWCTL